MPAARQSTYVRFKLLFTAVLGIAAVGCGAKDPQRSLPAQYPATVDKWHGDTIDHVEFIRPFRLESYDRLVVTTLDTSATSMPPKDNTYEPVRLALSRASLTIAQELQVKLKNPAIVVESGALAPGPAARTLVLRGRVTEMEPGSRAARYWVGMGAGAARVGVECELGEAGGQPFLRFSDARASSVGVLGGGYGELLDKNMRELADDVAILIGAFSTPPSK